MPVYKYNPVAIGHSIIQFQGLADSVAESQTFHGLTPDQKQLFENVFRKAAEMLRQEHEHARSLINQRSELMRQRDEERQARKESEKRYDTLQQRFDLIFTNYI
jgi:uncharacterized membrane protein YgaE (UPF0421/DUF939 family)